MWFHHPRRPSAVRHLKLRERVLHYQGRDMLTFTLAWTLPTTRTDGSALAPTDIANVIVADSMGISTTLPGAATTFTTGDLSAAPGAHAFSVSVVDTNGLASAPDVAVGTVPVPTTAAPSAVTGLTVTANNS
jgi:hypothetical protein